MLTDKQVGQLCKYLVEAADEVESRLSVRLTVTVSDSPKREGSVQTGSLKFREDFLGSFNFLEMDKKMLLQLAGICWFLPHDSLWFELIRMSVYDRVGRSELKMLCDTVFSSRNVFLNYIIENFNARSLFGNYFNSKTGTRVMLRIRPAFKKKGPVKQNSFRRGYRDKGNLIPEHCRTFDQSDWTLTELQNDIEAKRALVDEMSAFQIEYFRQEVGQPHPNFNSGMFVLKDKTFLT